MFNILEAIEKSLLKPSVLKYPRGIIPTVNPSEAMVYTTSGVPLGTCLRQAWFNKTSAARSNPLKIYNIFVMEAGKLWESWIIEQYKNIKVYVDHSVRISKPDELVTGEIDILHINPLSGEYEISEIKQYSGANWYAAKELLGSVDKPPKPKDQNLLQCIRYLMIVSEVNYVNLVYIDRSCTSFYNNKQFRISINAAGNPVIETYWNGSLYTYVETKFSTKDILDKEKLLFEFLKQGVPPPPDYQIQYTPEEITKKYSEGALTKKAYNEFLADPSTKIGDWLCRYCPYGRPDNDSYTSTCEEY
jgi:hypothetical protein